MNELYIIFHESAFFQILTPIAILLAIIFLFASLILFVIYIIKKKRPVYITGIVLFVISIPILIDGLVWRDMYSVVSAKTTDEMKSNCEKIIHTPLKAHKAIYYRTCSTFLVGLDDDKSVEYYEKYYSLVKKHKLRGENYPGTIIFGIQYLKQQEYNKAVAVFRAYDLSDTKIENICKNKKLKCNMKELKKALQNN